MNYCVPFGPDAGTVQSGKLLRILKILGFFQVLVGFFTLFISITSGVMLILGTLLLGLII